VTLTEPDRRLEDRGLMRSAEYLDRPRSGFHSSGPSSPVVSHRALAMSTSHNSGESSAWVSSPT